MILARFTRSTRWFFIPEENFGLRYYTSSITPVKTFHICIVGSGPAGFYTAQKLLKGISSDNATSVNVQVDLLERLPAPYGLVRYGVAPDHPEVKNSIHSFEELMETENMMPFENPRLEWIGGISLGEDVQMEDLRRHYDVVAVAIGAQKERNLGATGENSFDNIYTSMKWTGWVNGYPNMAQAVKSLNFPPILTKNLPGPILAQLPSDISTKAVIFGNGNVALDVARLLLTPIETLKSTDIKDAALNTLAQSSIKHVNIVGRRGPGQVSFTTAELREIFQIAHNYQFPVLTNRLDLLSAQLTDPSTNPSRPRRNLMKLFLKTPFIGVDDWNVPLSERFNCQKSLCLSFLESPVAFDGTKQLAHSIECQKNEFLLNQESTPIKDARVRRTDNITRLNAALFVKCIGYSVGPIPGLENLQDSKTGLIPNDLGKVNFATLQNMSARELPDNLFVSGWCKSGSSGQLSSTLYCAYETAESIIEYIHSLSKDEATLGKKGYPQGRQWLLSHLRKNETRFLLYKDWMAINVQEIEQGKPLNKPREKVDDLAAIHAYKHL